MKILVSLATLFVIGSVVGYIIELFYRRFVSQKRWVNPGFMCGPYIPLYGFGTIILFAISNFGIEHSNMPEWANILIILLIIGVMLTLIELFAGLVFIKGLHMKLWDYSDRWGNFKGLICPLFSLIWFACGALYYFFLNPILIKALYFIYDYPVYVFFVGIVIGMILVDFAYSLHLGIRVKKLSKDTVVKFEQLKSSISEKAGKAFYVVHLLNKDNIKEIMEVYKEKEKKYLEKLKNFHHKRN